MGRIEERLGRTLRSGIVSGDGLREAVLDLLREESGAEWAGCLGVDRRDDGALVYTDMQAISTPARVDRSHAIIHGLPPAGTAAASDAQRWLRRANDVRAPDATLVNRFTLLDEDIVDRATFEAQPVYERYYGPLEAADQLRMLVYTGRRFVRWLGCLRCGAPDGRFGERLARRMNRHADSIASAFVQADALDRVALDAGRPVAVVDGDGRILSCSPSMREWLQDRARKEALDARVKQLARPEAPQVARGWVFGWRVELTRLEGPEGPRWLLEVLPSEPVFIEPRRLLTPRQREVADLLAVGATKGEIARSLDLSPNTVKYHAKRIYEALDIASQLELVGLWAEEESR